MLLFFLCIFATFHQMSICSDRIEHKVAPPEAFFNQTLADLQRENRTLKQERDEFAQSYEDRRTFAQNLYTDHLALQKKHTQLQCGSVIVGGVMAVLLCASVAPATLERCEHRNQELTNLFTDRALADVKQFRDGFNLVCKHKDARSEWLNTDFHSIGKATGIHACSAKKREKIQRRLAEKYKEKLSKMMVHKSTKSSFNFKFPNMKFCKKDKRR